MSRRKALSAEEKQTRMLQLFHETKKVYSLAELEKVACKEKGIVANSVKEVVFKLVDQGLVDSDKIGTGVYFWSFPSKVKNMKKRKLEEARKKLDEYSKQLKLSDEKVQKIKENEQETKEKVDYIDTFNELTLERDELLRKLKKYEENDPQVLKKKREQLESVKQAANRWTDNIFSAKSWAKNKFGVTDSDMDKQLGIPPDFDYLE